MTIITRIRDNIRRILVSAHGKTNGVARESFNFAVSEYDPSIDIARRQISQPVRAWRNAHFVSVPSANFPDRDNPW